LLLPLAANTPYNNTEMSNNEQESETTPKEVVVPSLDIIWDDDKIMKASNP